MTDIGNINILSEAKREYTNQLQKIFKPRLYEGFKSIYEDIIKIASNEVLQNNVKQVSIIKNFQKVLKEIPQWNQEMIKKEYGRILKLSSCDYIDKLIEAVFVTNTKILTSVQINNNNSMQIKINIPQPCHFIHKCYIKSASEIYKNPYLFDISKTLTPKEKHNNLREALLLIELSINNAISDLLPIGEILKQSLMLQEPLLEKIISKKNKKNVNIKPEEDEEEEEEEEDEEEEDEEEEDDDEEEDEDDDDEEEEDNYDEEKVDKNDEEEANDKVSKKDIEKKLEEKEEEIKVTVKNDIVKDILKDVIKDDSKDTIVKDILKDVIKDDSKDTIVKDDSKKIIILNNDDNIILNKSNNEIKKIIYDEKILNTIKKTSKKLGKIDPLKELIKTPVKEDSSFTNVKTLYDKKDKTKTDLLKKLDEIQLQNKIHKENLKNDYYTQTSDGDDVSEASSAEEEQFIPKKKEVVQPVPKKEIVEIKKEVVVPKNDTKKTTQPKFNKVNPFIKKIKMNKFNKMKFMGGSEKNSSFYKKKYEQNSQNYNLLSNKEDLQTTLNIRRSMLTPVKNKIIVEENSSDEEDNGVVL